KLNRKQRNAGSKNTANMFWENSKPLFCIVTISNTCSYWQLFHIWETYCFPFCLCGLDDCSVVCRAKNCFIPAFTAQDDNNKHNIATICIKVRMPRNLYVLLCLDISCNNKAFVGDMYVKFV